MVTGNLFNVYLVIKLWYFLIVLADPFESGRLLYFLIRKHV